MARTPRRSHRRLIARCAAAGAVVALLVAVPVAASRLGAQARDAGRSTATRIAPVPGTLAPADSTPAAHLPAAMAATPGAGAAGTGSRPTLPTHRTVLPKSSNTSEPSLIVDQHGALYVTAPAGLASTPGSPLWKSTDGGADFDGPVVPPTAGPDDVGLGGADSDMAFDSHGDLFLTSLWLGNTSIAVSPDGGSTWTAVPWSHPSPVDDRPWLAYDPKADALYMAWDGGDGIHVGKALLGSLAAGTPLQGTAGLVFAQDVLAVPESAVLPAQAQDSDVRYCVCPPGRVAVDPDGNVWLAYGRQRSATHGGVGIAESRDGGLTWTQGSIPGSGADNDAQSANNAFVQLAVDSEGNAYVAWSQSDAAQTSQRLEFAVLPHGQSTWQGPVQVSDGDHDAVMPALAVAAPGVVDVAYYDAPEYSGYSEVAPGSARWDLVLARSDDALSGMHFDNATVDEGIHFGAISVSGITGGADRSLGDFFSLALRPDGSACIATVVQNGTPTGIAVYCQTGPVAASQPVAQDAGPQLPAFSLPPDWLRSALEPQPSPQSRATPAPQAAPDTAAAVPPAGESTDLTGLPAAPAHLLGAARAPGGGVGTAALASGLLFLLLSVAGVLVRGLRSH